MEKCISFCFFNKHACPYFVPKGRITEEGHPQVKGNWQITQSCTDMLICPSAEERPPSSLHKLGVQKNGCQCRNGKECTWPAGVPHALSIPQGRELEGEGESLVGAVAVVTRGNSTGAALNLISLLPTLASI